ncbi:DUF6508 domain-containing protein [uncultured Methanobacterium sp.]|uniref:DUF6508 domain-containing protein n=1 Tax=uncultured Methanobacterium sp. TaxID=176306 RepID=UPI0035A685C0
MVRRERFADGLLGKLLDDGTIVHILIRLEQVKEETIDRFKGAIFGLAVGDAMGVPLEFTDPNSLQPCK